MPIGLFASLVGRSTLVAFVGLPATMIAIAWAGE